MNSFNSTLTPNRLLIQLDANLQKLAKLSKVSISRRDLFAGVVASVLTDSRQASVLNTVAFDYAAKLSDLDLQFLAKFDVVVTGGVLSTDQLRVLRSRRARLVLYQWSSALYPDEGGDEQRTWQAAVQRNARSWLLAPEPVTGGAAAPGKSGLWYDFGSPELVSALARHVCALSATHGFEGIFFDTLGQDSLPAELLREYNRRHPNNAYDRAQAALLSKCAATMEGRGIIFTNQGYRNADIFLPHSDFDLIENSATVVEANGETRLRPLFDTQAPWESVSVPMTKLVVSAAQAFPKTQVVHLNYTSPNDQYRHRAVYYSYACAKLWNQTSYVAPIHIQDVIQDSIYFTDLGDPLTATHEEDRQAGVAWRRFSKGIVAVNSSTQPYRIRSLGLNLSDPPQGYVFSQ